jgi:hypothetical protein
MDYYTIVGLAALTLVAGLMSLRVARDEKLLRRKALID